jgi:formylglycine-generating enzyme required for sulfatase activity
MIYCLNPNCRHPDNSDDNVSCQSCGTKLISRLAKRYRVLKPLGSGGFSKTYLAEDTRRLNALCVVKQFWPTGEAQENLETLDRAIELFNQEAERLLQLEENSQIPTLYDYFEEASHLYLIQQFIKGRTLLQELAEEGCFSESKIKEILLDLLTVLQFIHKKQVVHRDLKPENIIRRESDRKLVLIDFGVSKELTERMTTKMGTTTGTLGYAPSEQMLYGQAYPASDLFSLGATCLHLLTGKHPIYLFNARESRWLWREKLASRNIAIDEGLGRILDNLLQDITKRYQSADAVLQDLHSLVPESAISAASYAPTQSTFVGIDKPSLKVFEFDTMTIDDRGEEILRIRAKAEYFTEDLGKQVMLEMVSIPGGKFMMGSPDTEKERDSYEGPQHEVTVAPFFLGKYPVTQAQWQRIAALPEVKSNLNPDPSKFKGANRPVETISWLDAMEFCARLSRETGREYFLPSEAQWEYACRAGTNTPFHFGETITPELANYDGNYNYASGPKGRYYWETTTVGNFPIANAFGLYDMHGLVWEWCADPWHLNYRNAPNDGSVWQADGNDNYRVFRGGSWHSLPLVCRSAYRYRYSPVYRYRTIGFRVAVLLE